MKYIDIDAISVNSEHPESIKSLIINSVYVAINNGFPFLYHDIRNFEQIKKSYNGRKLKQNNYSVEDYTYLKDNSDLILDEISELISHHVNLYRDEVLNHIRTVIDNQPHDATGKSI